jgi:hypothetical protein
MQISSAFYRFTYHRESAFRRTTSATYFPLLIDWTTYCQTLRAQPIVTFLMGVPRTGKLRRSKFTASHVHQTSMNICSKEKLSTFLYFVFAFPFTEFAIRECFRTQHADTENNKF